MICDSPALVRLLVLMAAVWINGFVNGQRSDRQTFNLVSIYNRSNVPKKGEGQGKQITINRITGGETLRGDRRQKNNTNTLITVYLKGVQSRDGECLEQPLLTSFVQAGNINSSQHQLDKNLAIVYNTIFFKSDHNLLFVQKKNARKQVFCGSYTIM